MSLKTAQAAGTGVNNNVMGEGTVGYVPGGAAAGRGFAAPSAAAVGASAAVAADPPRGDLLEQAADARAKREQSSSKMIDWEVGETLGGLLKKGK